MGIPVRLGFGLLSLLVSFAFADEAQKERFDKEQSARLTEMSDALKAGDMSKARALAAKQATSLQGSLKLYEKYGPHQTLAAADYAAAILSKDVVDFVVNHSSYSGQQLATVMNYQLKSDYGIELRRDGNKWNISMGDSESAALAKVKTTIARNIDKDLWASLTDENKDRLAKITIDNLANELSSMADLDDNIDDKLKAEFEKKSAELGTPTKGKIADLKKDFADALVADRSERRLLEAEKKSAEALRDSSDTRTADQYCDEFSKGLASAEAIEALQRRNREGWPCRDKVQTQLTTQETAAGRTPAITGPAERALLNERVKNEEDDTPVEVAGNDSDTDGSDSDSDEKKEDRKLTSKEQKAYEKALADQAAQASQYKAALEKANGDKDTLQNAYNLAMMCQRGLGAGGSGADPFGLTPGNQRNERMLSSLKDDMEKVLTDNYTATVCERVAKGANVDVASRELLDSLVPSGALTEADQKTLRGIAQSAVDQAGNFAKKRSTRMKMTAQMEETASKKALTRLTMEYSTLINPAAIQYLKSLSHNELLGTMSSGYNDMSMSALAKSSSNPLDPSMTLQVYYDFFETAKMDLLQKYGSGADYEQNADCALSLAKQAGARYSSEANRTAALFGPSRQAGFNMLNALNGGPTKINNAPATDRIPGSL